MTLHVDHAVPTLLRRLIILFVGMLSRLRSSRGRPANAPAAFIPPCLPSVTQRRRVVTAGRIELKHDGYWLQIHVRDGRVRLYMMNGADWTRRYPLIVDDAGQTPVSLAWWHPIR